MRSSVIFNYPECGKSRGVVFLNSFLPDELTQKVNVDGVNEDVKESAEDLKKHI